MVYGALERRGIVAVIPAKAEPIRSPVPLRRFRYDARSDLVRCPRGKTLLPQRPVKHGRFFYSKARDCRRCDLAALCLSKGRVNKAIVVGHDYPALLRARRRRERWSDEDRRLYQRHRWRSEGCHGEAKTIVRPEPDDPSATRPRSVRPRRGTGWPTPSAAACRTCASRPS